jgi:hypothetical protein
MSRFGVRRRTRVGARATASTMLPAGRRRSLKEQGEGFEERGREWSRVVRFLCQHGLIVDPHEGKDLVVARTNCLLEDLKALSIPAIEPSVGTDFPRKSILGLAAEQHGKGEAFRGEILAWKPAIRHIGRTGKPFSALPAVAYETRHKMPVFDQADCSRSLARVEGLGHRTNGLKVGFRICPRDRPEDIGRQIKT